MLCNRMDILMSNHKPRWPLELLTALSQLGWEDVEIHRGPSLGGQQGRPPLGAEGSGAGGVQTAKASRKQSSLSGKESAQGCIPKLLFSPPDSALHWTQA